MSKPYSFQDELAAGLAANEAERRVAEGKRKYARYLLWKADEPMRLLREGGQFYGESLAARIMGGPSIEDNTAALRKAAALEGRFSSGPLLEAAAANEGQGPVIHAEARRLAALRRAELETARHAEFERASGIAAARADRGRGIEIER